MNNNVANLYAPIRSNVVGPTPLVIRTIINSSNAMIVGGMPTSSQKEEVYVLLSCLPEDLRKKVTLTIQTLLSGI